MPFSSFTSTEVQNPNLRTRHLHLRPNRKQTLRIQLVVYCIYYRTYANRLMEKRRKNTTSARHPGQRQGPITPQLSCELCRERKVKCDKLNPCSNCVSSKVACLPIQRLRLPRGRHVHRSHRVSPQQTPLTADSRVHAATSVDENVSRESHSRNEAGVDSIGSARANIMFGGSREQVRSDAYSNLPIAKV